eukprot:Lankesteria_metandrocarpae@DN5102_c0_g1_i5.p1
MLHCCHATSSPILCAVHHFSASAIGQEQQKSTINVHPDKVASMSIAAGKQVHQPQDSQGAVEPAKPRKPMESSSGGGTSTFEQEHRPQIRVHHPPGGASSCKLESSTSNYPCVQAVVGTCACVLV